MPAEIQEELRDTDITRLTVGGEYDAGQLLYTDAYGGATFNDSDNYGLMKDNYMFNEIKDQYMQEIKVLVPEGLRDFLSMDTTRSARMCIGKKDNCKTAYRMKVRAMITKLPGYYFTAYSGARFLSQLLISEPQYREILEDFFDMYPQARLNYKKMVDTYEFSNGIPKHKVFVKMATNIT